MFRRGTGWLAAALMAAQALVACGAQTGLSHVSLPPASGGSSGFDRALVDPASHLLVLGDDGSQALRVFDVSGDTPRLRKTIPIGTPPKGLALDKDLHRVLVGQYDGKLGVVDVDPASHSFLTLISRADVGARSLDLLGWDSRDHKAYAVDKGTNRLIAVDVRNRPVAAMKVNAGAEEPVFDPGTGRVWLTNSDDNAIYEVDPGADKIVAEHKLSSQCQPSGLAIDPKRGLALVACSVKTNGALLLWDLGQQRLVSRFAQASNAGQALYDPAADRFIVAGVAGGHTAICFLGGSPVRFLGCTTTSADTRAVAYDPVRKVVYQPEAHGAADGLAYFPLPGDTTGGPGPWLPLLYGAILVAVFIPVILIGRRRAEARRREGRPMFS